jgi:hypothetical protein
VGGRGVEGEGCLIGNDVRFSRDWWCGGEGEGKEEEEGEVWGVWGKEGRVLKKCGEGEMYLEGGGSEYRLC